ncbi:MAG: histidinol-phosphate transaminase [Nitrososphaerales archaeon]
MSKKKRRKKERRTKSSWLGGRLSSLHKIRGYQKPERYPRVLRLDTNENMALPRQLVSEILLGASRSTDPREYPSDQFEELRRRFSDYLKVPKDCIAAGNGSDQIIDLLLATFGRDGVKTITVTPTFAFYRDRCNLHSIKLKEVALRRDFSLDLGALLSEGRNSKICYICSPNNPTGNQFARDDVVDLLRSFDGLVIVDEAYVDFADYSLKDLVRRYDNLVLLRTMSKAFGLAGARIGYMIANRKITEIFTSTIQYPYALSSISMKAASMALSRAGRFRKIIAEVRRGREEIYNTINSVDSLNAFRSDANFVLFDVGRSGGSGSSRPTAASVFRGLLRRRILVREIGKINGHAAGCLRVTVGTRAMNARFLQALKKEIAAT